jgi:hypothetical protein
MCKKLFFLLFLAAFLTISTAQAATIVFCGQNRDNDIEWRNLLEAEGHTVISQGDWQAIGDEEIATMNSADLVIFGPDAGFSTAYTTDQAEIDAWNAIETPMINMYGLTANSNRWKWVNTTATAFGTALTTIRRLFIQAAICMELRVWT